LRKDEIDLASKGITQSFYISRHDMDFYLALISMLKERGTQWSTFVVFCLKYVILEQGSDIFDDFQKHYRKVIETRLDDMLVKYKGKKMKLGDLIESELIKEKAHIKI
jgi:hypothetical protein